MKTDIYLLFGGEGDDIFQVAVFFHFKHHVMQVQGPQGPEGPQGASEVDLTRERSRSWAKE